MTTYFLIEQSGLRASFMSLKIISLLVLEAFKSLILWLTVWIFIVGYSGQVLSLLNLLMIHELLQMCVLPYIISSGKLLVPDLTLSTSHSLCLGEHWLDMWYLFSHGLSIFLKFCFHLFTCLCCALYNFFIFSLCINVVFRRP